MAARLTVGAYHACVVHRDRRVSCWGHGGYGQMGDDTWEAITLAAQTEGLLLDPVYTGKSLAGLIRLIRAGELKKGQTALFIHTGGTPALFGYQEKLDERLAT